MAQNKNTAFTENLINSLYELFKLEVDEAIDFLKEEGVDIDELDQEYNIFIKKALGKAEIVLGLQDRNRLITLFTNAVIKMKEMGAETLSTILTPLEIEQLSYTYRNLEKTIDENEKNEILDDERILKIMEKLNQDDK